MHCSRSALRKVCFYYATGRASPLDRTVDIKFLTATLMICLQTDANSMEYEPSRRGGEKKSSDAAGQVYPSLDDVLITAELAYRPARTPDYETENLALTALAEAMADSPQMILQ